LIVVDHAAKPARLACTSHPSKALVSAPVGFLRRAADFDVVAWT
jgi:hypothetical protein